MNPICCMVLVSVVGGGRLFQHRTVVLMQQAQSISCKTLHNAGESAPQTGRQAFHRRGTSPLATRRANQEFSMSITSLSFTLATTYAPQSAAPAAAPERKTAPVASDDDASGVQRPAGRQNRLVQAMMSALRELGFGSAAAPAAGTSTTAAAASAATPAAGASPGNAATTAATAAPATATPTPGTAATATTATTAAVSAADAASVESAVHQFAHALFQALRQGGGGAPASGDGNGRVEGEGHHRHHHHHREGHGYGDMAQRLEALSQTVGTPAAAPTTPAAAAANAAPAAAATNAAPASPVASSSLSVTLTVDDGRSDATTPATPAPPVATPAPVVVSDPATAPAATSKIATNPLLDAFSKLFKVLKPQPADAVTETAMADKLRSFLHTLAQAMAPDAMGSVQSAQTGSLINVTA
jgi:hypothetical protein